MYARLIRLSCLIKHYAAVPLIVYLQSLSVVVNSARVATDARRGVGDSAHKDRRQLSVRRRESGRRLPGTAALRQISTGLCWY